MAEVGRPSALTDELTLEIRKLVLTGTEYKTIQEILDIPEGTWNNWTYQNINNFRDSLNRWKYERIVKSAEAVLESSMSEEDKRIRLDAAKFALERLNKDFKNKTETDLTSGGKPIFIPSEIANKNDITTEQNS